ncbi:MAG: prepilin-type N-terminal cleavage/methylation domain-containing protein [Planctomycetota bacterium]
MKRSDSRLARAAAFTLIELLVVISIIALLIGLLLPALGAARTTARQLQSSTQLRGIHQGMFAFAQDNNGWYPGISADGQPLKGFGAGGANRYAHVSNPKADFKTGGFGVQMQRRYAVMLEAGIVPPEYLVSPADEWSVEADPNKPDPTGSTVTISTALDISNASFAMLSIDLPFPGGASWTQNTAATWTPSPLGEEWRDTANTQAIVLSDRAIADNGLAGNVLAGVDNYHSVWTPPGSGRWEGGALRNDGSVTFGRSVDDFQTQYGSGQPNQNDNLFLDEGNNRRNARLAHINQNATLSPK